MRRFEDRGALVPGGGGGIGEAACRRLAAEGGRVVVVDIDETGAQRVAGEIGGSAFRADVANPVQSEAMIEHAVETYGRLDVLDNNATGGGAIGRIADLDLEAWKRAPPGEPTPPLPAIQFSPPGVLAPREGAVVHI